MQNILEQPWLPIITVAQEDLGSPFQIFISDCRIQCRGQKEAEGKTMPCPQRHFHLAWEVSSINPSTFHVFSIQELSIQ